MDDDEDYDDEIVIDESVKSETVQIHQKVQDKVEVETV